MKQFIRNITIILFLTALSLPINAAPSVMIIDQEQMQQPAITFAAESTLRITNANGMMLTIYNVAGVRVHAVKIEGMDKHIDINLPKGCYIVKVGKVVRKISIK